MLTGSCNVRTLFRIASPIMLTHLSIWYTLDISAMQETRLKGQHIIETKTHTFILVGQIKENMNMEWNLL
jgi:hypothetical protein